MPELPDIQVYLEALEPLVVDQALERIRIRSPFLVRSTDPPIESFEQRRVTGLRRLGKRIVFEFDNDDFLVLHLMIAGRLRWKKKGAGLTGKIGLAAFDFPTGSLLVTEAGSKRRASLHAVHGVSALKVHDRGGLEIFECSLQEFHQRLIRENHTLKRALCDPHNFSGIGNAYSDEILHTARLSPFKLTQSLDQQEVQAVFTGTRQTLQAWIERLREQAGSTFPEKVTAFRPEMAVHGKYRQPCPACGSPIQRIVYANNETNYCPRCQTRGKILRDRALSRLLKSDWPSSLEELETVRNERLRAMERGR